MGKNFWVLKEYFEPVFYFFEEEIELELEQAIEEFASELGIDIDIDSEKDRYELEEMTIGDLMHSNAPYDMCIFEEDEIKNLMSFINNWNLIIYPDFPDDNPDDKLEDKCELYDMPCNAYIYEFVRRIKNKKENEK